MRSLLRDADDQGRGARSQIVTSPSAEQAAVQQLGGQCAVRAPRVGHVSRVLQEHSGHSPHQRLSRLKSPREIHALSDVFSFCYVQQTRMEI
uniref:Uncharacterized protein n=1 Tax=Timema poppense TaxID=170557 RepID=A0A7R9DUZ8_TIMPO|nr:unnamed protein product [Timema poppensis]